MQDIIYKRDFEDEIERWYTGVRNDCSLIVTGARQVGKTTGIINWAFPLSHHLNQSQFKLYYSDVGLLTSKLRLDYAKLVSFQNENTNSAIWGGVVLNYVAQELQTIQLYYWKGYLRSKNKYEVDFLLQSSNDCAIIPCEVKSHPKQHKQSTSLNAYIQEYKPKFVLCVGPNNFGIRDNKHFIPLYAVYKLKQDFDL